MNAVPNYRQILAQPIVAKMNARIGVGGGFGDVQFYLKLDKLCVYILESFEFL